MKNFYIATLLVAVAVVGACARDSTYGFIDPMPESCVKEFEEYRSCGPAAGCVTTCDRPMVRCEEPCVKGCFCIRGYVRDSNGDCVLIEKCPPKFECDENEKYVHCTALCGEKTCDHPRDFYCGAGPCKAKCLCKDGYVRNSNKKCIKATECKADKFKCYKENHEVYSECGAHKYQPTCDNPDLPAFRKASCKEGCVCEDGYIRDYKGRCIKKKYCEPYCDDKYHEVYSECGANGCQATCENPDLPKVCKGTCQAGCVCEEGYIRDPNGRCTRQEKCPKIFCDISKHQVYSECGAHGCRATCLNPDLPYLCKPDCKEGCVCEDGYIYSNGNCVLPKDCPKNECLRGTNVVRKQCKPCASGEDCPECVPGCFCKEGYVVNFEGKCVLPKHLPKKCRSGEEWVGCIACREYKCSMAYERHRPVCDVSEDCPGGCVCKRDLYRNDNGKCVKADECPPAFECKENEKYVPCNTVCAEKTCTNSRERHCGLGRCQPKCLCKDGYVRDANNNCIKATKCPRKCGQNEEWASCKDCAETPCRHLGQHITCRPSSDCEGGCACKKGFYRNEEGLCVAAEECPPLLECDENEKYVACTALCGEKTCDNPRDFYCGLGPCQPKCLCKEGYVRNSNEKCIKATDCKADKFKCYKKNHEIYSECGAHKFQPTCDNPDMPIFRKAPCVEGCVCEEGYIRDYEGRCIKKKYCEPYCDDKYHEVYSECGANGCQATCENPHLPKLCKAGCQAGCVCEEGYIRDPKGICIRQKYCPKFFCDISKHEVYSECGAHNCRATCWNPDLPKLCEAECKEGCVCEDGYLYANGMCVLPKDCPSKKCSPSMNNEIPEPCPPCHPDFPEECRPCNGCLCKEGFVYNFEGECVLPKDLPKRCRSGEQWVRCAACNNKRCSSLFDSNRIICDPPRDCPAGCICKSGLYLNNEGKCVAPEKCPLPSCGKHEQWVKCTNLSNKFCSNLNTKVTSRPPRHSQCREGCVCKEGYYRLGRECVVAEECPKSE